jgi:GAF domain-containing protein
MAACYYHGWSQYCLKVEFAMPFEIVQNRFDEALLRGTRELLVTLGVFAYIENDCYELVAVQSNSGAYVPGEQYSLGNSFCKEVMLREDIVSETKIDNAPLSLHHPLYRSLPLECFIGAPVYMHGELWGSLDFSSMAQRDTAFSEQDIQLVSNLAKEISEMISASDFLMQESNMCKQTRR